MCGARKRSIARPSDAVEATSLKILALLASVCRTARRPEAMPLGPIRSLHYFLPVIEELLANPGPDSTVACLRSKVIPGSGFV